MIPRLRADAAPELSWRNKRTSTGSPATASPMASVEPSSTTMISRPGTRSSIRSMKPQVPLPAYGSWERVVKAAALRKAARWVGANPVAAAPTNRGVATALSGSERGMRSLKPVQSWATAFSTARCGRLTISAASAGKRAICSGSSLAVPYRQ